MGSSKTTVEGQQQTQAQPTAAEQEMQNLQLQQYKTLQPAQTELQQKGMNLVSQMFAGGSLPGYFGEMAQGISPEAMATQASLMAKQNMPGFQQLGLGDSGVAFKETARDLANNLMFPAEQFNIGAKQNLLNLALSGQAQVQAPIQANTNLLSQQLQGLRSNFGSSNQTTRSPFGGLNLGIFGQWGGYNTGA